MLLHLTRKFSLDFHWIFIGFSDCVSPPPPQRTGGGSQTVCTAVAGFPFSPPKTFQHFFSFKWFFLLPVSSSIMEGGWGVSLFGPVAFFFVKNLKIPSFLFSFCLISHSLSGAFNLLAHWTLLWTILFSIYIQCSLIHFVIVYSLQHSVYLSTLCIPLNTLDLCF